MENKKANKPMFWVGIAMMGIAVVSFVVGTENIEARVKTLLSALHRAKS